MNWFKFYLGDYARKTAHLSLLKHGAYLVLLQHYYAILEPFENKPETWFRITRSVTQEETQAVTEVVNEFFPLKSDGLRHNKRADEECKAWKRQAEFNRKVGALGGRPKNPTANPRENPHQKLEVRSQKNTKSKTKANGEIVVLPDWIPQEHWQHWIEARTKKRNAPTVFAQQLAIAKLDFLRQDGHHPAAVLAQSAFHGWAGLFPVKEGI